MKVLITGGSRGIGKGIAIELAKAKHDLLLVAKNKELLENVSTQIKNEYSVNVNYGMVDLLDIKDIQWLKEYTQKINFSPDVLVFSAGIFFEDSSITNYKDEEFHNTMEINFKSTINLIREFIPSLKSSSYPRIIFIGSTAAYEAYSFGQVYGVSKWALRGLAVNLRQELMKDGIGVTYLAPGGTLTDLWAGEDLAPDRLLSPFDIGKAVGMILNLSKQAVVEEIVIRPMLGDMH